MATAGECVICLKAKKLVALECHGNFCRCCILQWLARKPNCPVCRAPVDTEIFFQHRRKTRFFTRNRRHGEICKTLFALVREGRSHTNNIKILRVLYRNKWFLRVHPSLIDAIIRHITTWYGEGGKNPFRHGEQGVFLYKFMRLKDQNRY